MQNFKEDVNFDDAKIFIKARNPSISEFYLDRILKKIDIDFINKFKNTDII